jgi:hypothetical protein
MSVLGATLLVLAGLAIMGFGIFLFYAWLPFLYGLFGLEIGLLLGRWFTGGIGLVAIIFGIVSAVILFCAAYFLEPYRRILLGLSAGAMVGLSIAAVFGLDHFLGGVIGVILAVVVLQSAQSSCRGTSTHSSLFHLHSPVPQWFWPAHIGFSRAWGCSTVPPAACCRSWSCSF